MLFEGGDDEEKGEEKDEDDVYENIPIFDHAEQLDPDKNALVDSKAPGTDGYDVQASPRYTQPILAVFLDWP